MKWWATQEALTAVELLARLEEKFGIRVHRNTLTGILKRAGLVWKRTRHSLKNSLARSSGVRPAWTRSIICCRKAAAYGIRCLCMVGT
ncbi:winged helix-turn-helix domain-containing protein [Cupriavidus sp. SK-3]|uniref:winged helix-turn-helix domain-containing protein n=1 Tax=Cupriavidus TaxID=106589 RepID=UPI0039C8A5C4